MKKLILNLVAASVVVVILLGLGSNFVLAQHGSILTPTPTPIFPVSLPPAPGTRVQVNDDLFLVTDECGAPDFVDHLGNHVDVFSKDTNTINKRPVPLPRPY
ncbi:MAG: hypothetical protein HZB51_17395 [Chloroflexi bacterium]|nr:hypothetical protein [Chloroflexota bacterium]